MRRGQQFPPRTPHLAGKKIQRLRGAEAPNRIAAVQNGGRSPARREEETFATDMIGMGVVDPPAGFISEFFRN
jgi:hypothetical protein